MGISVPNADVPVSPGFSSSKTGCYNIFVTSGLIFLFFCKMTAGAVTFLLCEVQIRELESFYNVFFARAFKFYVALVCRHLWIFTIITMLLNLY